FLEMDRRGSSCPTLFAWGGEKYQLVADMLGDGVVGHWVGPGQRNIPRPTEYVKIDRNMLHEKDDSHFSRNRGEVGHPVFSFRFMEPLEEVVYLDKVGLLAVDHPADFDVFPNEYFASNPPFPEFKLVFSRDARPPAGGARTMIADLSGKLRVGTKRIRITTNLQIYWDNILISRTPQNQKARLTSVPLTRADLRFHGFPLKTEGDPPGNVKYVYEEA